MRRRSFMAACVGTMAMTAVRGRDRAPGVMMTVAGPIAPDKAGLTLPHEHVMVDFIGAPQATPDRYDRDEVFRTALEHLQRARDLGCVTFVECTPAYLARDPILLRRLARATGLNIITNTGYYNAGGGKYLPDYARAESADQLADRLTHPHF
jgi:predicted metal-dependent phosphotriesterase family hydrolase